MKVALYNLTTTTQFGGVESFVWQVGRELAEHGLNVTLVSGRGNIHYSYPRVEIVEFPFLSRARLRQVPAFAKAYTLTKLVERLTFGMAAVSFMRRAQFDIIHIQKPYDLPISVLLKSLGSSRIVFGCHGTDFFRGDVRFARRTDASVSCSAFNAGQVRAHYGITARVVFNGIDPELFHPQPIDQGFKRGLAGDDPMVLYVGRLVRWKGVQYLIDAVSAVAREFPVSLVIAGEGEYRPNLEAHALSAGMRERVKFVGFVPQVNLPRYYFASDILCVPSYANETFSISALEAMACGRATIGSNFGGIPEVIVDGETGMLARPEDAQDLASKIKCLLRDPARRGEMGESGRRRALERFTWKGVTERVLGVYTDVMG